MKCIRGLLSITSMSNGMNSQFSDIRIEIVVVEIRNIRLLTVERKSFIAEFLKGVVKIANKSKVVTVLAGLKVSLVKWLIS